VCTFVLAVNDINFYVSAQSSYMSTALMVMLISLGIHLISLTTTEYWLILDVIDAVCNWLH